MSRPYAVENVSVKVQMNESGGAARNGRTGTVEGDEAAYIQIIGGVRHCSHKYTKDLGYLGRDKNEPRAPPRKIGHNEWRERRSKYCTWGGHEEVEWRKARKHRV